MKVVAWMTIGKVAFTDTAKGTIACGDARKTRSDCREIKNKRKKHRI